MEVNNNLDVARQYFLKVSMVLLLALVKMILLLCFAFFVGTYGAPYAKPRYHPPHSNIIGGSNATAGEFPYQLSLQDTSFGFNFHFCEASIYNENWGISAAQCFQGEDYDDPSYLIAVAGELEIDVIEGFEQTIHLSHFIQHEDFNGFTHSNDVALLRVSKPFVFNDFVQPIDLPPENHTATGDCLISGWGATSEGGQSSKVLMKATVPIVNDKQCYIVYGDDLEESMICAGLQEGGVDTCIGDNGGPLVCSDIGSPYLAGLSSWGYGCARPGIPGVYSEVAYYVDWIQSHVY